jgi:hypothetical protein
MLAKESSFFLSPSCSRFAVLDVQAIQVEQSRGRKIKTNLFLLQKTPFLAFKRLGALFVIAPLDGIAHRRHDGGVDLCLFPCLSLFSFARRCVQMNVVWSITRDVLVHAWREEGCCEEDVDCAERKVLD